MRPEPVRSSTRLLTAALALFVATGCFGRAACPEDPSTDVVGVDIAAPPDTGPRPDVAGGCPCLASMEGQAFRFDRLWVTEPGGALADFLNSIWTPDVARYILNIVLVVDSVDTATGEVVLLAGSAWHDTDWRELPYAQPEATVETPPSGYLLNPGFEATLHARVNANCEFETYGLGALDFHPGPPEQAFGCSKAYNNAIPVGGLIARARLTDSCTRFEDGRLDGCIAEAAACEICSYSSAPNYTGVSITENPAIDPKPCDMSYCQRWCGTGLGWSNFQWFVANIARLEPACWSAPDPAPEAPADGYKIAGEWAAGIVPRAVE